jgi:hypothetical protein
MKARFVSRREIIVLLIAIGILAVLGMATTIAKPFSSVELKFTDASSGGLAIVPASCASYPHYGGDCTDQVEIPSGPGACKPQNTCLGGANVINSCTGRVVEACQWGCIDGACLPPPPAYTAFTGTLPNGTTFTADGHLQGRPLLVRLGDTTQLYWNVENVSNCTVTSNNGDALSGASSGASGTTTKPLVAQTTYTLFCNALPKVTPATITESIIVNIAPVFQEL